MIHQIEHRLLVKTSPPDHHRWPRRVAIAIVLPLLGLGMISRAASAQVIDKQVTDSAADTAAVQYLDDLKTCIARSQNVPMPLPFVEGVLAQGEIIGWENETCVVETTVFLAAEPETQTTLSYCQYTPATLALMTDDIAYEQARTGNVSFSTDNERDMALSTAMERECEFNFEWFEELTSLMP